MYTSKIIFVFSIFLSVAFANPHYYLPHNAYGAHPSIWSLSESEPSAKVSSSHSEPPCSNSVPVIKSAVSVPNVWNGIAPLPSSIHNGGTVSAVQLPVSHSNQKGETIIHRPAPIVVRRPPTKIQINHPPLVVKPAPVIFHKPPAKVIRPTVVKNLPQQVQVEPVFMKVLKPAEKKVIVSEPSCTSGVHYPVPYHHHHHHY